MPSSYKASVSSPARARKATKSWVWQGLTAYALIPLSLWFVCSLILISTQDRQNVISWLSSPFNGGMMLLFIWTALLHASFGIRAIIDDYIPSHILHTILTLLSTIGLTFLAFLTTLSLLKILF